jgi:hypothetical protein
VLELARLEHLIQHSEVAVDVRKIAREPVRLAGERPLEVGVVGREPSFTAAGVSEAKSKPRMPAENGTPELRIGGLLSVILSCLEPLWRAVRENRNASILAPHEELLVAPVEFSRRWAILVIAIDVSHWAGGDAALPACELAE